MEIATVVGGGGTKLHVREWGGKDAPPILFVHGWSQNHLAWKRQFDSSLADEFRLVAIDLRGHGMSEAPTTVEAFTDASLWAADIAAVIEQRELVNPLLVSWSFGGFVISDYLNAYGDSKIAGINYVGWGVIMGNTEEELRFVGRGFHDFYPGRDFGRHADGHRSDARLRPRLPRQENPAGRCRDADCLQRHGAAFHPATPARCARQSTFTPVISKLDVPILATYGTKDTIALPIAGEHIVRVCKHARGSFYEGAGHAPFIEDPERFNRELAAFANDAYSGRSSLY